LTIKEDIPVLYPAEKEMVRVPCEGIPFVAHRSSIWTEDLSVYSWGQMLKWLARISLIVVILYTIFGVAIPITFGWWPTYGRSMRPTLPIIGGYTKISKTASPYTGAIVRFHAPNGGVCVKRIEKLSADGKKMWLTADNKGWTGEDSDQYGWVSTENLIGVASDIWSPKRFLRSFAKEGRLRNWSEFTFSPTSLVFSPANDYVAAISGSTIRVFNQPNKVIYSGSYAKRPNTNVSWKNGSLVFPTDGGFDFYCQWEANSRKATIFDAAAEIKKEARKLVEIDSRGEAPDFPLLSKGYGGGKKVIKIVPPRKVRSISLTVDTPSPIYLLGKGIRIEVQSGRTEEQTFSLPTSTVLAELEAEFDGGKHAPMIVVKGMKLQ